MLWCPKKSTLSSTLECRTLPNKPNNHPYLCKIMCVIQQSLHIMLSFAYPLYVNLPKSLPLLLRKKVCAEMLPQGCRHPRKTKQAVLWCMNGIKVCGCSAPPTKPPTEMIYERPFPRQPNPDIATRCDNLSIVGFLWHLACAVCLTEVAMMPI